MPGDLLITVASWEDRFLLGLERSLSNDRISDVVCLASKRYEQETAPMRERARLGGGGSASLMTTRLFDFEDQVECYREMAQVADDPRVASAERVVLDVSTAPRTLVWMLLGFLKKRIDAVVIRYQPAAKYASWQTNEEGDPRLVLNRSGIMYPDKPTCLVMLCGPEISRAEKMFYRFEPRKALVLRDPLAAQFGTVKRLPVEYGSAVEELEFDNKDLGKENLKSLEGIVAPYLDTHNVVAASLGPKMGAILLFKLSERQDQIALSYVISGRHNLEATEGIGEASDVELRFS
jgi:hypothetical protein